VQTMSTQRTLHADRLFVLLTVGLQSLTVRSAELLL
jgi:hypothetical protein